MKLRLFILWMLIVGGSILALRSYAQQRALAPASTATLVPPTPPPTSAPWPTQTPAPSVPTVYPTMTPLEWEWLAVQNITLPWKAQDVLSPEMTATGVQLFNLSAALGMSLSAFEQDQIAHPARIFAQVQRVLRETYTGPANDPTGTGLASVEAINDSLGLIDVSGLSPAEEAHLFTAICTRTMPPLPQLN